MQKLTPVEVLRQLSFGERVAEEEIDQLANYFVETDNWNQVFEGNADLIYGAKGSGKSAIYNLLLTKTGRDSLFDRKILTAAGENPQGAPAFAVFHDERERTEADFVYIWKLYILSICVNCMRDFELASSSEARKVIAVLEEAGLVSREFHLRKLLNNILEYLQRISIVSEVSLDSGGSPSFKTKLSASELHKADAKQRGNVGHDLDDLFDSLDRALEHEGYSIWILLDRLDVAFSEKDQLERNVLRALFRCYRDLRGYRHIGLKIFLRDDIWERITKGGMTEASHFVRKVTLAWSRDMLLNLMVKRIMASKSVRQFMKVNNDQILSDLGMQEKFFYEVFPKTVGGRRASFDWVLERTSDATKKAMPREVIHFSTNSVLLRLSG